MSNRWFAALLLVVLAPVLTAISALVFLTLGWPILYRQRRSGMHGQPFDIVKFRSMRPPRYADEPDRDRINAAGRLLRSSSLDELPSLWNVLRGDMVFVGPRPFIATYAAFYDNQQSRRLEVRPGLTGWSQVNGRNALTWEKKFELDVWYVEHKSWSLDMRILLKTPLAVLRRAGLSHPGHTTMPTFDRISAETDSTTRHPSA